MVAHIHVKDHIKQLWGCLTFVCDRSPLHSESMPAEDLSITLSTPVPSFRVWHTLYPGFWKWHMLTMHIRHAFMTHGWRKLSVESRSHTPPIYAAGYTHLFSLPIDGDVKRFLFQALCSKIVSLMHGYNVKRVCSPKGRMPFYVLFNKRIWILLGCTHNVTCSFSCVESFFVPFSHSLRIIRTFMETICIPCIVHSFYGVHSL